MISVVMPAYNAEKFIRPAVESILNQTFAAFELIVVDDGSTDHTRRILEGYEQQDPRLRIITGKHAGISAALNTGVEAARYDWIARMDADDIALPERFAVQWAAAQAQPEVVAWGGAVKHINGEGVILSSGSVGPTSVAEFYRMREAGELIVLYHPTALFRKDVFIKAGCYNPKLDAAQDVDLWNRMAAFGAILTLVQPLLLYRVHNQSISMEKFFQQRTVAEYVRARNKHYLQKRGHLTLERYLAERQQEPAALRLLRTMDNHSRYYYRKAGLSYGEGRKDEMAKALIVAAALNPFYTGGRLWRQMIRPRVQRMSARASH